MKKIIAESWVEKSLVRQNAEDDAKINYYADKILEALNANKDLR